VLGVVLILQTLISRNSGDIISLFYGIIISLYFFDNRQHKLPHIHVRYQEHEAVFSIPDGNLVDGEIPPEQSTAGSGVD
jgi:hypothetical protein